MITFIILLITIIVIAAASLFEAIFTGSWLIAVFGDFIVFGLIVWLIIKIIKCIEKKK